MSRAREHGFSLSSVCWGYRDIFARTLQELFDQGLIGDQRPEVTEQFFALMNCAEESAFDHVLREFLGALNPHTKWMLSLPEIFGDVTDMGRRFAACTLYYGVTYFRILGQGGFGSTPRQVRTLIDALHCLLEIDCRLALALVRGYRRLAGRLDPHQVQLYVAQGIEIYRRNCQTGLSFMEGTLKSSEQLIRSLTRECRLEDERPALQRLLRALVGCEIEVDDLGHLDSDELLERGTSVVCLYKWLYVPSCIRRFDSAAENRNWYRLITLVAAACLAWDSFPRLHARPDIVTCADLVGRDLLAQNLFQLIEYARVLDLMRQRWPGVRQLLAFGVETCFAARPSECETDQVLQSVLLGEADGELAWSILEQAQRSVSVLDTAERVRDLAASVSLSDHDLARVPVRILAFLPDFMYPGRVSDLPQDSAVADLAKEAQAQQDVREQSREQHPSRQFGGEDATGEQDQQEVEQKEIVEACFLYDEWSEPEGDYHVDYCHVHERPLSAVFCRSLPDDLASLAARTRRTFELLRPEWGKEKRLRDGDEINVDQMIDFMVSMRREPSPKVDFYEKRFRRRRDLATLILIDVSGSTGQAVEREKTIELEKHAALVLGQGLSVLQDRFAVCGFSGNGREQCEFFVYKDFEEGWDRDAMSRVMSAYPHSATRIGAALRHAGYRLSTIPAKQRLIMLITDGRPTDRDYDPATRYAQYDVRMACVENRRRGIHTFCVSTLENSRADMEIMFPDRMFAILPDIDALPAVLPKLYVKMTV